MTDIHPFQNASINEANPWDDDDRPSSSSSSSWGRRPQDRKRGGPNNDDMPPEFEEFFRKGQENFKRVMPGGFNGKSGFGIFAGVVFVIWLLSGVYSVGSGEQGVVLRFGEFVRVTPPGLHMHLPWPVETVLKPNIGIINQMEIGLPSQRGQVSGATDGQMLTQDKNILNMHFRVQWQIQNPQDYLFNLRDPQSTIRAAAESVMRELVGQMTFDQIVTNVGRDKLSDQSKDKLQRILDAYKAGVLIVDMVPQKIDPPAEVIDAFNDVQRAQQDAEKEINQAEAYRSDIVPRARGEAQKMMLDAQAYKERSQKEAEGEAQRFLSLYNSYRNAGEVTMNRMYYETMQDVLKNTNKIIVDQKGGMVSYLPLQDMMKSNRAAETAPALTTATQ